MYTSIITWGIIAIVLILILLIFAICYLLDDPVKENIEVIDKYYNSIELISNNGYENSSVDIMPLNKDGKIIVTVVFTKHNKY